MGKEVTIGRMLACGGLLALAMIASFVVGARASQHVPTTAAGVFVRPGTKTPYDRLRDWCRRAENQDTDLARDLERLERGEVFEPAAEALVPVPHAHGSIYVCHLFWNVAVCWMDDDCAIRAVRFFNGKAGFSLSWDQGLIVTCHEHPGTDLFCDTARHVAVSDGGLAVD